MTKKTQIHRKHSRHMEKQYTSSKSPNTPLKTHQQQPKDKQPDKTLSTKQQPIQRRKRQMHILYPNKNNNKRHLRKRNLQTPIS